MFLKKFLANQNSTFLILFALIVVAGSSIFVNSPVSATKQVSVLTSNSDNSANSSLIASVETTCVPDVTNLTAGQTHVVGTLTVWNDTTNLYVKYDLTNNGNPYSGCSFGTLHLWVGTDFTLLPKSGGGAPIPGQFPYQVNASGLTSYTFTIPLADLTVDISSNGCGALLYIVAHAEVNNCTGNGIGSGETAFGGDIPGSNTNRWYFYNQYTVCCDTPPPPPPFACGTAFAKGGWVFTTDNKSNPERLPSLNLTRNRWGWAININPVVDGVYNYNVWVGAGLNKITNGVNVGTLTVTVVGNQVTVTYNLNTPMEELHIYASDFKPQTIAPGQYGYTQYFSPKVLSHTATFTVTDTNGDGIWIIAHAVVCGSSGSGGGGGA